jgi:hypothetical protein
MTLLKELKKNILSLEDLSKNKPSSFPSAGEIRKKYNTDDVVFVHTGQTKTVEIQDSSDDSYDDGGFSSMSASGNTLIPGVYTMYEYKSQDGEIIWLTQNQSIYVRKGKKVSDKEILTTILEWELFRWDESLSFDDWVANRHSPSPSASKQKPPKPVVTPEQAWQVVKTQCPRAVVKGMTWDDIAPSPESIASGVYAVDDDGFSYTVGKLAEMEQKWLKKAYQKYKKAIQMKALRAKYAIIDGDDYGEERIQGEFSVDAWKGIFDQKPKGWVAKDPEWWQFIKACPEGRAIKPPIKSYEKWLS